MTELEEDDVFEDIMQSIGDHGPFQKRFNYVFNFLLVLVAAMPYLNIIISLEVPNHWCKVPGRELTNFSVDEWKELTIPRQNDTRGVLSFSKCKMYNYTYDLEGAFGSFGDFKKNKDSIIDCKYGWEYDTTWYKKTAPSQENWVCDRDLYVANSFVFGRIGDVLGMFIFGQLGDAFGRRPVFFISLICLIIGRTISAFTAHIFWLFLFATVFGSLTSTSIFSSPLIIAMEISRSEDRAYIAMLQCMGWTMGFCLMPLIMWMTGDWVVFMLITTIPSSLYLFSYKYIIESPRWLLSKNKLSRCVKQLQKIAKTNGTKLSDDTVLLLRKAAKEPEKAYGVLGLFSSWRLAKNTALLVVGWVVTSLIYFTLTLNVSSLGGNPFLNYFWQALAELPAYILGKYSSNWIGRRFTNILAFLSTFLGCLPLVFIIRDPSYAFYSSALAVYIKFSVSFAFYAVNLQSLETYPTCLRQTGTSIGGICASAFGILGPYIVYLGTTKDARYPYIISAILAIIGVLCGLFLPETLNQKLPETLSEAQAFGADQKFWSIPKKGKCEPKPIKA